MSAGWADAVARAPNVSAARIATKATVLLRGPSTITNDVVPSLGSSTERTIHAKTMAVATPNWGTTQHMVQIASQRSEADVLAVFRRLQQEQPTLFSRATLSRI